MQIVKNIHDFTTSLEKALEEIDPHYQEYPGVIVAGTHLPLAIDDKIEAIRQARENKIPFLGICFGFQLAVIEFCRNVLGLNANTAELDEVNAVIVRLPQLRVGIKPVKWADGTTSLESHWHNYALMETLTPMLSNYFEWGTTNGVVEWIMLKEHPFFWATQFHGEYQSSKTRPHKLLVDFLNACRSMQIR